MSTNLTHGSAEEVERWLMSADGVTTDDLHGALCNAMRRIAYLESRLNDLSARVAHDDTKFEAAEKSLKDLSAAVMQLCNLHP
jgi:hypothetical protein